MFGAWLPLTINTGSSSLKTALYRLRKGATETSELRAETSRVGTQRRGVVDIGSRTETTGGKHMLPLARLVAQVFVDEGLPEESVKFDGKLNLPGYYRPTKNWDLVVIHEDIPIAAVELKSIATSFGRNLNNRIEEAVGSGEDIRVAYREGLLGSTRPWLGYLFLIADEEKSRRPVEVPAHPFLPMDTKLHWSDADLTTSELVDSSQAHLGRCLGLLV